MDKKEVMERIKMVEFKGIHAGTLIVYARTWYDNCVVFRIEDKKKGTAETNVYDLNALEQIANHILEFVKEEKKKEDFNVDR